MAGPALAEAVERVTARVCQSIRSIASQPRKTIGEFNAVEPSAADAIVFIFNDA